MEDSHQFIPLSQLLESHQGACDVSSVTRPQLAAFRTSTNLSSHYGEMLSSMFFSPQITYNRNRTSV